MSDVSIGLFGDDELGFDEEAAVALESYADGADAIVCHDSAFLDTNLQLTRFILRTPAYVVGLSALLVFVALETVLPGRAGLGTDERTVERVADQHDLPVHRIGSSVGERGTGLPWAVGNWLLLGGLVALQPVETVATAGAFVSGATLLLYACALDGGRTERLRLPLLLGWLPILSARYAGLLSLDVLIACVIAVVIPGWWYHFDYVDACLERIRSLAHRNGYDRVCVAAAKSDAASALERAPEYGLDVRWTYALDRRWLNSSPEPTARGWRADDAPAGFGRRTVAAAIDAGIVLALLWFVGVTTYIVAFGSAAPRAWLVASLVATPLCYVGALTATRGRTFGKGAVGIAVVSNDDAVCTPQAAVLRTLLVPVDLVVGLPAVILDAKRQRVGDRVADTMVVSTTNVPDGG